MKFKFYILLLSALSISFSGCYPDGPDYVDELDIVYTNYDPSFDFKAVNTFALPDSVVIINGSDFREQNGVDKPEFVTAQYATVILNTIRNNLINRGWSEVDKSENPDVILLSSVTNTTYVYYYYDWYYWNWWYPDWQAGWGWYYPGYYYPIYRTGYHAGTLFIQMTDSKNSTTNFNISVPWSVEINGLMQGSVSSIKIRLKNTIDQAFDQSPYLNH